MNFVITFLKKSWNSLILSLQGQLVISFFIVYSVFFSSFNIWRAFSACRFTLPVFLWFLGGIALLSLLFWGSQKLFERVLALIFSDFSWRHHKSIGFGIRLMRDRPFVFAIYASLSLSSFYLIREFPEGWAWYTLYVGCVIFRNIFLLPYLGYSLIVKINEKKVELLSEEEGESSSPFPLFSNTSLLQNMGFCGHVQNWTDLVSELKPSPDSSRKISLTTAPTTVFWAVTPTLKKTGSSMIDLPFSHIKNRESGIFPILNNGDVTIPQDLLLKKIAFTIIENTRLLQKKVGRFQEMGPLKAGLYAKLNPEESKRLSWHSLFLLEDSEDLSYCFRKKLQNTRSHELLICLATKYVPECVPQLVHDLSLVSQDFETKKELFTPSTPREDFFEFAGVFRGFFFS